MQTGIMAIVFLIIYFLPTINAYSKKKKNKEAVMLVNLFFGWTILGWFIALIWSSTND